MDVSEFRAAARSWLAANVPLHSGDHNPAAIFTEVADEQAHLAEARRYQALLFDEGWAGITWPEEHGGRGLTPLHQVVWVQEAAPYDLPTGLFSIGIDMGGPTILAWGDEGQKRRWLRPMLRGDEIWCQLFSEPNAGSDVASVQTRAMRDGDEWVVNGQKTWTSGAQFSRWGMLLARTDGSASKHEGLTYFVIDMDQPGVEVRPLRQMTGGANFNEVFFTDARVGADQIIGSPGMGWSVALTTLMNERASIGGLGGLSGAAGNAALRRLLAEVEARTGNAPNHDPVNRMRLADIAIRIRVLEYQAGRIIGRLARGEIPTAEGSVAKLMLTDLLERIGNFGVDAPGALGMLNGPDAVAEGQWALAFLGYPGLRIAGGTDEIMRNIVGERVLGLPREPRV
jgi:alkylation response protein AidB-like acyl-CoA dehydrogenase